MPQGFTPSFESIPCELLSSYVNVKGEEVVRRRVRTERTHVERVAIRMAERREETWRPMNRQRVEAFVRMYLLVVVYDENAYRQHQEKRKANKILNEALVKRVIPFIFKNRVWTLDESLWPLTLEEFEELNHHLADKLPKIHAGHQWQMIVYFYEGIKREREEWRRLEEMETGHGHINE